MQQTEAYERSQRPRLLFNMANAAERIRNDDAALSHYRRYLEEIPDAENATYVNSRIDALLSALAEPIAEPEPDIEPIAEPEPEPEPQVEMAPDASGPPVASIALLAGGGVLAVAGAIMLGVGTAERGNVDGAPQGSAWADYQASHVAANTLGPVGGAVLGLGAAVAVVVIIVLIAADDGGEAQLGLIPTGNGLLLRGRF